MKQFVNHVTFVIQRIYVGKGLLIQILAILLTYISLESGFDWYYFTSVRNETLNSFFLPALLGMFLVAFLLPLTLLVLGKLRSNQHTLYGAYALAEAAFVGWFISSCYKAFTGRVQPNLHDLLTDSSHSFNFGFLEHGIFWGWPSSHTAVAFAMAYAAIAMFARTKSWKIIFFVLALYVGIGVSLSIHWFSEFVAGALIGSVIGSAVGAAWKKVLP